MSTDTARAGSASPSGPAPGREAPGTDAAARRRLTEALLPGARALRVAGMLSTAATAATAVGFFAVAAVAQDVLDAAVTWQRDTGWLVLLVGAGVLRALLSYASGRAAVDGALIVETRLRTDLLARMLQRRGSTASSAARTTMLLDEVERIGDFAERSQPARLAAVLTPIMLLVVVFPSSWVVGVLLILCAPLAPVNLWIVGAGTAAVARRHAEELRHLSGYFLDRLRGLATLRRLGAEDAELRRVDEASQRLTRSSMAVLRVAFISSAALEAVVTVAIGVVATYVGLTLLNYVQVPGLPAHMSLRTGLFVLMITPLYFQPLRALAGAYHERGNALAAAEHLAAEGSAAEGPAADGPAAGGSAAGGSAFAEGVGLVPGAGGRDGRHPVRARAGAERGVEVRDLAYSYPGREEPALHGLTFTVGPGERLGVTGVSGAGKSTLLRILAGDLRPGTGEALIGGVAAASAGPDTVTWLGQRPYLFPGTLRENITLGRAGVSDQLVLTTALDAGMAALLLRLPGGLDTQVGEAGWGLSGGEAHRVTLARTLLAGAPVLLLDEPTAHLDAVSEVQLVEVLEELRARSTTTIIATHSAAVLASCDRVLLVDRGRVGSDQVSSDGPTGGRPPGGVVT